MMVNKSNPAEDENEVPPAAHQGGIHVKGDFIAPGSQIAARDLYANVKQGLTAEEMSQLFLPLLQAVQSAPPEKRQEAEQKVEALKEEVSKGKQANDQRMAGLLDDIVKIVPEAVKTLVATFAHPILTGLAGQVTQFVLSRLAGG